MPTLKNIQEDFCECLLNDKNTAIIQQIYKNKITPEFRLSIYRNNIYRNLRRALEITFPAIWKLVGQECADGLAYAFVQDKINLPVTNCLDDWGKNFPEFLQNFKSISHLVYLKDIAQLEWLKHLSYCAKDYLPFDPAELKKMLDNPLEKIRLLFNPTVFLFSSPYFLKDIFDLVLHPTEKEQIHLQLTPCYVVVTRQNKHVLTHWVSEEMFHFLSCIHKDFTLTESYEYVLQAYADFDLIQALQFMLKSHILWKWV